MTTKRNPLLRKRRKKESGFKYCMALLHLWLGLLSSIVVFIVCLSGSIYAFKQQIEDLVNSEFLYVVTEATKTSVTTDTLVTNFERRFGTPTSILMYEEDDRSVLISSFSRESAGVAAYFDPYSGKLLGVKSQKTEAFFAFVLDLHRFLLAGDMGKFINGTAVLIMVFMLLSGLVLWFPKKLKQLKKSLLVKWPAKFYRVNYDLHKVLGFYAMLLLMFMAITGLYVSFTWVKNAVIVGLGGDSILISEGNLAIKERLAQSFHSTLGDLSAEEKQPSEEVWTLEGVLNQSKRELPYEGILTIVLPNENVNDLQVTKLNHHNAVHFFVPDRIEFSSNGRMRKVVLFKNLVLNEQFKALAKPLHTGEIMGLTSIIFYFAASLIGCSLPITGFVIWWKKTR